MRLKVMPLLVAAACLAAGLAGCSRGAGPPLVSPSGAFALSTEVSGEEAGPTRRSCVRLVVVDRKTGRAMTHQTGASNTQKWAVGWAPKGSIVLYSSDVGISAFDVDEAGGRIVERPADEAERLVARDAYARKYGRPPRG